MSPEGISEGIMTLLNNSVERLKLTDYLTNNEYGNQQEVNKYIELIDNIDNSNKTKNLEARKC